MQFENTGSSGSSHMCLSLQPVRFNLSCMLFMQQQRRRRRSQEETRLHDVTWQRVCVWAHGPCGALSEATTQSTKGEFLLAKRMHAIPTKIPGDFRSKEVVIFMGARFKLSHLEYVRGAFQQQPRSHRAALYLRHF